MGAQSAPLVVGTMRCGGWWCRASETFLFTQAAGTIRLLFPGPKPPLGLDPGLDLRSTVSDAMSDPKRLGKFAVPDQAVKARPGHAQHVQHLGNRKKLRSSASRAQCSAQALRFRSRRWCLNLRIDRWLSRFCHTAVVEKRQGRLPGLAIAFPGAAHGRPAIRTAGGRGRDGCRTGRRCLARTDAARLVADEVHLAGRHAGHQNVRRGGNVPAPLGAPLRERAAPEIQPDEAVPKDRRVEAINFFGAPPLSLRPPGRHFASRQGVK